MDSFEDDLFPDSDMVFGIHATENENLLSFVHQDHEYWPSAVRRRAY